ncbi:hypothetical protein F5Y18DRAFT_116445 [Xylariaceae sp. FL1019]|nr:hypothetical protein F5Y18DRAFT_116445 [Xylariaceae sp. FL1019]
MTSSEDDHDPWPFRKYESANILEANESFERTIYIEKMKIHSLGVLRAAHKVGDAIISEQNSRLAKCEQLDPRTVLRELDQQQFSDSAVYDEILARLEDKDKTSALDINEKLRLELMQYKRDEDLILDQTCNEIIEISPGDDMIHLDSVDFIPEPASSSSSDSSDDSSNPNLRQLAVAEETASGVGSDWSDDSYYLNLRRLAVVDAKAAFTKISRLHSENQFGALHVDLTEAFNSKRLQLQSKAEKRMDDRRAESESS